MDPFINSETLLSSSGKDTQTEGLGVASREVFQVGSLSDVCTWLGTVPRGFKPPFPFFLFSFLLSLFSLGKKKRRKEEKKKRRKEEKKKRRKEEKKKRRKEEKKKRRKEEKKKKKTKRQKKILFFLFFLFLPGLIIL
jgi:flagellar biosynthesis component FlhA